MRIPFFIIILLHFFNAQCQTDITSFDRPPTYPGGDEALFKYIEEHLEVPKKLKKEGVVYLRLTINEKGRVTEKEVLRSSYKELEAIALDAIKYIPNWEPALKDGVAYEEKVIVPVQINVE